MIAIAVLLGYALGSLPTASWLGRRFCVDLRSEGSGNPGANNAFRLGGPKLGGAVLGVEVAKGAIAALAGMALSGEAGLVAASLGAAAGNLYNVYMGFRGGKGLGITAGILLVAWPTGLLAALVIIGVAVWATHSSDAASLIAAGSLAVMSVLWRSGQWATGWGIEPSNLLVVLGVGLAVLIAPKHTKNIRFRPPRPEPHQ